MQRNSREIGNYLSVIEQKRRLNYIAVEWLPYMKYPLTKQGMRLLIYDTINAWLCYIRLINGALVWKKWDEWNIKIPFLQFIAHKMQTQFINTQ